MAKDKTVAVATATKEVNEENVMDAIRSKNIAPTDLAKEIEDDIAKENKEKAKSKLKSAIMNAQYETYKSLLYLKKRRREAKITKESLEAKALLLARLTGKTRDGKDVDAKERITPVEYKDLSDKQRNEDQNKMSESEEISNKELRELNDTDCGQYRNSWYW